VLDGASDDASDVTSSSAADGTPGVPFRIRGTRDPETADASSPTWRQEARIAIDHTDDGDEREWLVIESLASEAAKSEDARSE